MDCLYHSPLVTSPNQPNPEVQDISVDFVRRVVRELAVMGTHTIIVQGAGEPLLHARLLDIIFTVKEAGLYCLKVSIWANAPEELQGNSLEEDTKNFNKIRRGLKLLNEAKAKKSVSFPQIELYQEVNWNNYQSVAGLVKLAQEHNYSGVHFGHLMTQREQLDEQSLGEIWNRPSLRTFRRRVSTREGLACVARKSDCYACCFFGDNFRVERICRWFHPFGE